MLIRIFPVSSLKNPFSFDARSAPMCLCILHGEGAETLQATLELGHLEFSKTHSVLCEQILLSFTNVTRRLRKEVGGPDSRWGCGERHTMCKPACLRSPILLPTKMSVSALECDGIGIEPMYLYACFLCCSFVPLLPRFCQAVLN